jgi:hypothetical protein
MSIERAPSTVSLVLAQVQRVEPKPPIFLLPRFTEIFGKSDMAGCFSFGKSDMADCFSFGKSDMAGCFSVPCPLVLAPLASSASWRPADGKRSSSSLGDQVLALATGKTQQEITAACKGARANHVGAAISRHKRAGRIEQREGKLYATQSARTEQRAAV